MIRHYEKKLSEDYMEQDQPDGMPVREFLKLVEEGVTVCEEQCNSRDECGQIACHCIRSIFPHPDYFVLYEKMREIRFTQEFSKYLGDARRNCGDK